VSPPLFRSIGQELQQPLEDCASVPLVLQYPLHANDPSIHEQPAAVGHESQKRLTGIVVDAEKGLKNLSW
jgi:hypothetical protein